MPPGKIIIQTHFKRSKIYLFIRKFIGVMARSKGEGEKGSLSGFFVIFRFYIKKSLTGFKIGLLNHKKIYNYFPNVFKNFFN